MREEEKHKKAKEIYHKYLRCLEKSQKGKIVAIETSSGDYFIGDDEVNAYEKAIKKYPNKTFCFLRIGFKATHFVGAF